jgi:hypothetical protein
VPELAVEIISPNEGDGIEWEEKVRRYQELGVKEVVRFDPEAPDGARLRAWDRLSEDLVERVVTADRTPCLTLGLTFVVRPVEDQPVGLRLECDDGRLLASQEEAAEQRIRELEEELRRRG